MSGFRRGVRAAHADEPFAADAPVALPRVEVSGAILVPITPPISAITGDARALLDTPRAATTLDAAWLAQRLGHPEQRARAVEHALRDPVVVPEVEE